MEWISVEIMPEFDGEYLCVVHEVEECGAEYNRIKVMEKNVSLVAKKDIPIYNVIKNHFLEC
jgi:hypothetical protein